MMRPAILAALVLVVFAASARADQPTTFPRPFVGLWITRYDFRTAEDVRRCIALAASIGGENGAVTDIFWQVRGQGDAFYKSELEPWGRELLVGLPEGRSEPAFDPLTTAIHEAHARKLKLHAWVNIMPLWKGKAAPIAPTHAYNAHPEWRLKDTAGTPQPLNDHYVIVNPLLPAVHDHIVAVCKDLVSRYPIDGLHMDYVRFVSDSMSDPAAYPRDTESLLMWEQFTGRPWQATADDKAALRTLTRDRITVLVNRIKREIVSGRPGAVLTAAVWRRPDLGRETYLQDAARWLTEGTLDRACPMIYTIDDQRFQDDLSSWVAAAPGKAISPGLGIYLHQPAQSGPQLEIAEALKSDGFALFAYAALFESVDPNQDKSAARVAERADRLKGVSAELSRRPTGSKPAAPASQAP